MSHKFLSRSPRLFLLLAVIFGFGLGVWVDRKFSYPAPGKSQNPTGVVAAGQSGTSSPSKANADEFSGPIPKLSGLTPLEARKILDGVTNSEIRKAAIRQCLAGMPRDKWNDWIQGSMAGENPSPHPANTSAMARYYTALDELMNSVAGVDPVGFMAVQNSDGALNNDGESASRMLVMMQWAGQNPAAAKSFLTEQLAKKDAAPGMSEAARFLGSQLIRQGDPGVLAWVGTLPGLDRAEVGSEALMEISRTNPKEAAEHLELVQKWREMESDTNRGRNFGSTVEQIADRWAKLDTPAALVWAAEQTGYVRERAFNGALQGITSTDFDAALEAVRKLPPEVGVEGLRMIIGRAPAERLGEMASLVEQQPESATRAAASANLMASWTDKNPEEASAWMARQPAGEMRDSAISAFVRWADVRDPEAALLWAGSMADSAKRMDAVEHIIGQLNGKAPAAVQPWLDSNTTLTETERSRILEKMNQPR